MTTEYFRVRNGLLIGEQVAVDAVTGDIETPGTIDAASINLTTYPTTNEITEGTNQYYTESRARSAITVSDSGGLGAIGYDSATGVITYTGPSDADVRQAFSAGTGVAITSGAISIGQSVGTTDNATFASVSTTRAVSAGGGALSSGMIPGYTYPGIGTMGGHGIYISNTTGGGAAGFRIRDAMLDKNAPFNTATGCNLLLEASRGSNAAPANLNSGDLIGGLGFSGYGNGAWLGSTNNYPNATIAAFTTEAWSSTTGNGAEIRFTVQPTTAVLSGTSRARPLTIRAANLEIRAPLIYANANNGQQSITVSGTPCFITTAITKFSPSGAWVSTLPNGTDGQVKMLACPSVTSAGTMTITVTGAGWPGAGTITFNEGGQGCTLLYLGTKWTVIGSYGCTFA